MKKNTITIDLEKIRKLIATSHFSDCYLLAHQFNELLQESKIDPPCTLTEAVEYSDLFVHDVGIYLTTQQEVEKFKAEYLDKEEVLSDGIYRYGEGGDLCFVKNGKSYANSWAVENNAPFKRADELKNPMKIAEI